MNSALPFNTHIRKIVITSLMILLVSPCAADESWLDLFPPDDQELDWIQLKSGEWLRGDFKVLYDYMVEFESEELDLLEFDLEDVRQLRVHNEQKMRLEHGRFWSIEQKLITGHLTIVGDDVKVENEEGIHHYNRRNLIAVVDGVEKRRNKWSGNVSLGINVRSGNSDTIDTTLLANLQRRTTRSRLNADYVGNFSQAGDIETANNQRLNATIDWFITTRFFWRVIGGEYYRDPFSNIAHQYSLGSALGYDLINSAKTEWEIACGGGYQNQEFVSVAATEDGRAQSPFFLLSTKFDRELTDDVDLLIDYNLRVLNEESGTVTQHGRAKLSTEFIGDLDIDISFIFDRIETPQVAADGSVPEKNDYQLVFSLGYKF
jgi:hypothetical protein